MSPCFSIPDMNKCIDKSEKKSFDENMAYFYDFAHEEKLPGLLINNV